MKLDMRIRIAIREMRRAMASFGYSLDKATDEEIFKATHAFGTIMAQSGITVEEAVRGLQTWADALPPDVVEIIQCAAEVREEGREP